MYEVRNLASRKVEATHEKLEDAIDWATRYYKQTGAHYEVIPETKRLWSTWELK